MYFTSPTQNTRTGVPIEYSFTLGGTVVVADRLYSMSPVSCQAEPLDGKFNVSELKCVFVDTDGYIWTQMGKGTSNLDTPFSATVAVGGFVAEGAYLPTDAQGVPMLRYKNSGGGTPTVIHSGKIYEVSRKGRLTTLVSKSRMRQVADLEWRFPVYGTVKYPSVVYGSYLFLSEDLTTTLPLGIFAEKDDSFSSYIFMGGLTTPLSYATLSGRGSMGVAGSQGFVYTGTQFFFDYKRFQFNGTYLGVYEGALVGTETDAVSLASFDATAKEYGFANKDTAATAIFYNSKGTFTNINRTRLSPVGDGPNYAAGTALVFQQSEFFLEGNPTYIWNELLTGNCVTPYFSGTDIDSTAYGSAAKITAYQNFNRFIDPKGGEVLPFIKDLLEPLQGLFSVNSSNKLRLHLFGPRNYSDTSGTISSGEVIESEVVSNIDDKINRVSLSFGYDQNSGSFTKQVEIRGTGWGYQNDYPLVMESPWLINENEARTVAQRIVRRFSSGVPRIELKVPLSQINLDIGSIVVVTDPDLNFVDKSIEIVGWEKDFDKDRCIQLSVLDAEAIYKGRGYARWEDATTLTAAVTGTSTSGWGTNGTVNNINVSTYGPRFVWW